MSQPRRSEEDVEKLDKEASMLGIPPQQVKRDADVILWRSNIHAVQLFERMLTQWRVTPMGGVIGLDYSAVMTVLKLLVKKKEQKEMFYDLQELESGYLTGMRK